MSKRREGMTDFVRSKAEQLNKRFFCQNCQKSKPIEEKVKKGRKVRCLTCENAALVFSQKNN